MLQSESVGRKPLSVCPMLWLSPPSKGYTCTVLPRARGQGTGRPGQGGDRPSWSISSRRKSHSRGLLRVPHSGLLSASQPTWHRVPLGLAGSENSASCHLTVHGARKCITRGLDRRRNQRAVRNITTEWDFKLKSEKLKSINKVK